MRVLRIFAFDVVAPAIVVSWLFWKYPEKFGAVVPWLAFGILWHLTSEMVENPIVSSKSAAIYGKWKRNVTAWIIAFAIGGCISLIYWAAIGYSLRKLASSEIKTKEVSPSERTTIPLPQPQRFNIGIYNATFANFRVTSKGPDVGVQATFLVVLKNTQSASSADRYRLSIRSPKMSRTDINPFVLPEQDGELLVTPHGKRKILIRIKREQFLYKKTIHAIATGDTECGWLVFDIFGITIADLDFPNTEWELSFLDVDNILQTKKWKGGEFTVVSSGVPPPPQCDASQIYEDETPHD